MSRTLREVFFQCEQVECGHVFVVHAEAVRTIVPSMAPDTEVHIPLSPRVLQAVDIAMALQKRKHAPMVTVPPPPQRPALPAL